MSLKCTLKVHYLSNVQERTLIVGENQRVTDNYFNHLETGNFHSHCLLYHYLTTISNKCFRITREY